MAKFDPFLSLDCARVEGVGRARKGSNFAAQRSGAIVQKPEGPNTYDYKNPAISIWQPWAKEGNEGSVGAQGENLQPLMRLREEVKLRLVERGGQEGGKKHHTLQGSHLEFGENII